MASWASDPARVAAEWHCYRHAATRWPPLYHAAGAARPEQESGRWHRQGEGYAQYLSLSPTGAWAELIRYYSIRDEEFAREHRRNLWLVLVSERDIADLSTFEDWAAAGLDPAVAVGPHAATQDLADDLRGAGYRGVLAPSAALPGVVNLTLFGERYERVGYGLPTIGNPDPDRWLLCERVAAAASPPADLTMTTCFQNQPHIGLELYAQQAQGNSTDASR